MNREMRRLQQREERRSKQRQAQSRRAAPQTKDGEQLSLFGRLIRFLREVRQELKRVNWPTREQMVAFTAVTLITSTVLTLYVFGLDFVLKRGVLQLLELGN